MKPHLKQVFATLMLLFIAAPAAQAQVDLSSSVFFGSPYVWRGEVLSSGWVFQPAITVSYSGLSATIFGNIDPNSMWANDNVHLQEADVTLAYGTSLSNVALSAGYTFYNFPTPVDDEVQLLNTQEFFVSAGLTSGPVQPSIFVAYDFDENVQNSLKGVYAEAKVGVPFSVGGHEYGLGAALGLDGGYLLPGDETRLSHLALTASTAFEAGSISISPLAGFQASLADVYKESFGDTFFYGGLSVGF